jgi:hypothetical protein
VWDVFAILTYLTVSTTFLYVGLIPDIAVLRDRETNPVRKRIYAMLSLGWRNTDREWRHFARMYLFLAAFSTPLVLSVHSVVSFDFAMSLVPGWHTTIFPPYFVAGAIFSGSGWSSRSSSRSASGSVSSTTSRSTTSTPRRSWPVHVAGGRLGVHDRVLHRVVQRLQVRAGLLLEPDLRPVVVGGLDHADLQHDPAAVALLAALRRNTTWLFILSIFINIGMWFERFVIVVPSLSHEFSPWQWTSYAPTWVDYAILRAASAGSSMWFLLFIKQFPVIAIAEVKEIVPPRVRTAARARDRRHGAAPGLRARDAGREGIDARRDRLTTELDALVDGIEARGKAKVGDITVYSPTPRHEIEHAYTRRASPVRGTRSSAACSGPPSDSGSRSGRRDTGRWWWAESRSARGCRTRSSASR